MNYRTCKAAAKAEGERTVAGMISTTTIDRDGEVLLPSGMDVGDYLKNPVVLFAHDSASIPVGRASEVLRTRSGVKAKVTFAKRPPEHPEACEWIPDTLHHLFREGVLSAFSVGFTVPDGGIRDATAKDVEAFGPGVRRVITRWSLHEFSIVPVPANPDALATAVSKATPYVRAALQSAKCPNDDTAAPPRLVVTSARRMVVPGDNAAKRR